MTVGSPSVLRDGNGMDDITSPSKGDTGMMMMIEEAPAWFKMYETRMKSHLDQISGQIADVVDMVNEAKHQAEAAMEMTQDNFERIQAIENDLEEMKAGLWTSAEIESEIRKFVGSIKNDDPTKIFQQGDRQLQVVAGGFDEDTDAEKIIATLDKFLNEGNLRSKVVHVGTFTDPAQVGVIEFETESAKLGFYRKLRNANTIVNDVELWFNNNRTFEERKRDKALGIIKYNLIEIKKLSKMSVRIDWKNGFVKIRGKKVATVTDEAEISLDHDILDVKDAVDAGFKAWLVKKGAE